MIIVQPFSKPLNGCWMKWLNKKERNLLTRPWITTGILKSIKDRDKIHRSFLKGKDDEKSINKTNQTGLLCTFFASRINQTPKRHSNNIVNIAKNNSVVPVELNYNN